MTYNKPEVVVLGDAAELIQGVKPRGFECGVRFLVPAEESEDS